MLYYNNQICYFKTFHTEKNAHGTPKRCWKSLIRIIITFYFPAEILIYAPAARIKKQCHNTRKIPLFRHLPEIQESLHILVLENPVLCLQSGKTGRPNKIPVIDKIIRKGIQIIKVWNTDHDYHHLIFLRKKFWKFSAINIKLAVQNYLIG